jgi:hypothetical protein
VATSSVYLSGGPCNGRTVPASEIQGGLVGYILCRGHYYLDSGRTRPNGNTIFADSGTSAPQPPSGGGSTGPGIVPNVYKSWGDLRSAVNRDLPRSFVAINHVMDGTKRKLRHSRKVRH